MATTTTTPTGTQRAECPFDRRRSAKLDRIISGLEAGAAPFRQRILHIAKRYHEAYVPAFTPSTEQSTRLPWRDTAGEEVRR